ncbi:MAG: amylo-alpha,6-glucosidase [Chloroflexota bacterium]|nr:amylo-alpha,6-glucosidase [Chloroflexota bacterium]
MTSDQTRIVFAGYTVLCTAPDGSISDVRHGLFHRDARLLSRYGLRIADAIPDVVSDAQPESDRWVSVLRVPRQGGRPEGPVLPQDALELQIRRRVGPGIIEHLAVRNHSAVRWDTTLSIDLDADFADVAELDHEREQQGQVDRVPETAAQRLRLDYVVEHAGRRVDLGLLVEVMEATSPAQVRSDGLRFDLHLEGGGEWTATLRFVPQDPTAQRAWIGFERDVRASQRAAWRDRRPSIVCSDRLRGPFERAADDLFDLRNWDLEEEYLGASDGARWILNAGVPTFTGLFGRDAVTAGWQSSLLGSRASRGALQAIATSQSDDDDPWRDAEPGKLIHERRAGPVAALGLDPRDAYYGTQTTPAMFVLALSELWHWTGDIDLLRRYRPVAVRALDWARRHGDADGDGFLEYERRSPRGLRNQGWKDSDEAIRYPDGTIVAGPIATVEEQAFHILALERMAEIHTALGDDPLAEESLLRSADLRRRWHDAYWMADEGFYALALDGEKRQVRSISSNPGHALGAGVVPPEHARAVADRLMAADLFSGWGVRSLSDVHPSYNPFAYHLGAIWPVEQATFALGLKRYGLDDHLDRLVEAVLTAAAHSPGGRLPEALSGHGRASVPFPVPYPKANSPQAWSASALIQLVQIMLGLYPFAPLGVLAIVHPRLPAWLPDLTIHRLRIGGASVDLGFERRADGSAEWRVLDRRGRLVVVGAGPPNPLEPRTPWDQVQYGLVRRAPGRSARAARIAIGLG